ncbi:MAG TPA: hypothetical protein VJY41_01915 [Prolixibacteraceae bacterium]|nr:hypothetical protein [Prolixibacteraceae bacterium]
MRSRYSVSAFFNFVPDINTVLIILLDKEMIGNFVQNIMILPPPNRYLNNSGSDWKSIEIWQIK